MEPGRRRAWVALGLLLAAHPSLKRRLKPGSSNDEEGFDGSEESLDKALALLPPGTGDIFRGDFREWADKQIFAAGNTGVAIVTWEDATYPPLLRRLPDPPPSLYVKGALASMDRGSVAVVGSRRASLYGTRVAEELGGELAAWGVTVVSGAARGIDSAAHRGSLACGGPTVGVLGTGIDVVYPKENAALLDRISRCGALVTEYPMEAPPLAQHFPVRNRIIAGLSHAVVVVEAARDSGSLITARLAADELGLPVGVVPGPITSQTSQGCNDMIYDGAVPVRDVQDILDLLPDGARRRAHGLPVEDASDAAEGLDPEVRRALDRLDTHVAQSADELAASLQLASGVLLGHLLELEVKGLAARLPGGMYIKKH